VGRGRRVLRPSVGFALRNTRLWRGDTAWWGKQRTVARGIALGERCTRTGQVLCHGAAMLAYSTCSCKPPEEEQRWRWSRRIWLWAEILGTKRWEPPEFRNQVRAARARTTATSRGHQKRAPESARERTEPRWACARAGAAFDIGGFCTWSADLARCRIVRGQELQNEQQNTVQTLC
jgi:hypothetical protein